MGMFQTTRWSVLLAGRDDPQAARLALEHLCQAYWRPVLSYVRRMGYARDEAEDLTQAFFTSMIERRVDSRADPQRGRFRTLLLTALKHYLHNAEAARRAERRGGGARHEDLEGIEPTAEQGEAPEQVFMRQWAVTVLDRAMLSLQAETRKAGKGELFDALREFLIEPPGAEDYARLAAAHGLRANTLAVAVHRLRQKLRQHVRAELAETVGSEADLDAEMEVLRDALGGVARAPARPGGAAAADGKL